MCSRRSLCASHKVDRVKNARKRALGKRGLESGNKLGAWALGASVRRCRRVVRVAVCTAPAPDVLENSGIYVVAIVAGDASPEWTAVSVINLGQSVLVDAGVLVHALNVLSNEA